MKTAVISGGAAAGVSGREAVAPRTVKFGAKGQFSEPMRKY